MYDVFFNCPVKDVDDELKATLDLYVASLQKKGLNVFYPLRSDIPKFKDEQELIEFKKRGLRYSDEMHVWYRDENDWNLPYFMGVADANKIPIIVVNPEVEKELTGESLGFAQEFINRK